MRSFVLRVALYRARCYAVELFGIAFAIFCTIGVIMASGWFWFWLLRV